MSLPSPRPSQEILHESPWTRWNAIALEGSNHPYYYCDIHDYCCAVPKLPNGKTLVVEQYRPAVDLMTWECPAGLVDREDSLKTLP